MKKKHTLLLYEKEIFLNSIFQDQFLYSEDYQLFIAQNEEKLLEVIKNYFSYRFRMYYYINVCNG